MKKNLLTLMIFLCAFSVFAQKEIKGTVVFDGMPMIGVSILEKGSSNGTVSDTNGAFNLVANGNDPVLVFSMIGFKKQEITVGNRQTINIELEEDINNLDELVVIGYGSATKKEITSSIASVKGEDLTNMVVSNVSESLQGLASGVQVITNGGGPGAAASILIRGIVTNQGTDPLLVVDGIALPQGTSLNFLNPSDIEDLQILKDGSATSIYGTRASNGVILITTKRGGKGTKVTATGAFGVKNLQRVDLAGANEYAQVMNQRLTNDGSPAIFNPEDITVDTDWWSEVYQDFASIQDYNIQMQTSSDKLNNSSSIAYHRSNSHLQKGYYERITGRFNFDLSLNDRLFIQQDLSPRYEHWENTPNQLGNVLRIDPLTSVFLPFDQRVGRNQYSIYDRSNNFVFNPVAAVARQFNKSYFFGMFSNTNVEYDLFDYLTISSRLGLSFDQTRNDSYSPQFVIEPNLEENPQSIVGSNFSNNFSYVWNNLLNFDKSFGNHSIKVTTGVTAEYYQNNYISGSRSDIILDNPNNQFLDGTTGERITANGNEFVNSLFSYLARGMYGYDDKYYVSASFRRDGSSRFPPNNRWANFYSISGAWNISNESFFTSETINNLKIKGGFGQVGNQNIPSSAFMFLVNSGSYVFGQNRDRVITNQLGQFGNPLLQWETVEDINIGIEATAFNNKLTLSVDWYDKNSNNLLFPTTLPLYTGVPSNIIQNVGSFKSRGLDISIQYTENIGDFNFNVLTTLNTNESKAIQLAPGNERLLAQRREEFGNNFLKISEIGQPVGMFYGFQTNGLFTSQEQINSYTGPNGNLIQPNARPGDLIFIDQNNDGALNEEDMTFIGNPFPDFTLGINANASYKNWDFNMQWYGTFGNDIYNYQKYFLTSGVGSSNFQAGLLDQVWSETNPNSTIPLLTNIDPNGNFRRSSDYFVEDGTYFRLKNIQLGYTFKDLLPGALRVYVSGQNLLTFTKYTGLDPEISAGGGIINGLGIDFGRYPLNRTFLIGLNLNF
ncbi:TonB-dependent receptor [Belliella sp. R4-6]|uniref:TonB-dependent receptor n=1 Tax=Belliella alkalica TaxID=1730871 RepID=A0ABS9VD41_9BACT|nr:TonB-dependent receptor [Belliella alkalica]MCH7414364.1 TonB-dependent receptor [Belliella alkalica]